MVDRIYAMTNWGVPAEHLNEVRCVLHSSIAGLIAEVVRASREPGRQMQQWYQCGMTTANSTWYVPKP